MTPMTKLAKLHAGLGRLKRRRRNLRWGTGYTALAVAVLWVLIAAFVVDWLCQTDRPQRVVLLIICAGALIWAFRRFTRPWLGARESELDVALLVERHEHIDSDLVAALQFESPEAPAWGSVQMEEAVIDHTAHMATSLDVTKELPRQSLRRRTKVLIGTAVLVAVSVWLFPEHAATFLNRMLLGMRHYPTRTVIEAVMVNGRTVDVEAGRHAVVEGQPVRFEVTCSGQIPEQGQVQLELTRGGGGTVVPLERAAADSEPSSSCAFGGELARLADPVRYRIYLGDAWTDPVELLMVPLPVIQVSLDVTPPDYASGPEVPSGTQTGLRQIAVVEGSQVRVRIASDKELRDATLSIEGDAFPMARPTGDSAASAESGGDAWALEPAKTPLAAVIEPIRYAVQVTDVHGLQLEHPIQGVIRIKSDHPPRVTASIRTEYILPTARPRVFYEALDDYGIARVSILRQVVHDDGQTVDDEEKVYQLAQGERPARIQEGVKRLDLGSLKLVKGDQLRVTVQAIDHRGPREGRAALSEPLVFQVTDEQGILAAISEADQQTARELKEMIQRQIGVGEEP
jgi:hypothetical protein